MLQGMGHLQGFGGSVLPAPSLLLCQAGSAAVPRGTGPAPLYGPGRDPLLQFGDALPARRLQVREGGAAVPGSARPGSAPPPRLVPGTSRALLKQKLPLRNHLRADRRRQRFPALASLLLGAFWLRGEDKNPPVKSRHGMRGGGEALPDVQHSKTREERTPTPRPGEGRDGKRPPWQPVRSLRFLLHSKFPPVAPK